MPRHDHGSKKSCAETSTTARRYFCRRMWPDTAPDCTPATGRRDVRGAVHRTAGICPHDRPICRTASELKLCSDTIVGSIGNKPDGLLVFLIKNVVNGESQCRRCFRPPHQGRIKAEIGIQIDIARRN